jgi:signal transduction histidine kinase
MSVSSEELRRAIGYSAADEALLSRLRPRLADEVPLSDLLVRADLAPTFEELASGRIALVAAVEALALPAVETQAAILALHRRVDLAVASEAQRAASARTARIERLALFGQIAGSIGHELRNPLGVIGSSLYLLSARPDDVDTREKHLQRIFEQTELATQIISDLLALIDERNARPGKDAPFPVDALLADALSILGPVTVRVDCEDTAALPLAQGDRGQLRQALRNLLDNACRAARTHVNVSARALPDAVEIVVEDDGIGVDPSVVAHLFEPLQTARPGGLGLGLALVRHIAERNGGSVRNEPSSAGARFVLRIRRAEPA